MLNNPKYQMLYALAFASTMQQQGKAVTTVLRDHKPEGWYHIPANKDKVSDLIVPSTKSKSADDNTNNRTSYYNSLIAKKNGIRAKRRRPGTPARPAHHLERRGHRNG